IKQSGVPVLVIDDQAHSEHYFADVVLNQNLHAHEGLYRRREAYTRLLLGTRFVLLRREFLKWRSWRRRTPVIARRILVTLGGGAHDVVLLQLLEALAPVCVSGLEVLMVRGGGHDGIRKVRAAVEASGLPVRLEQDVWDMSQPMSWCDVAVSAGGSTCWELSFMGVPMATIVLSDNQAEIAASLEKADVGINLGAYDQLSVDRLTGTLSDLLMDERRRARMSRNGRNLVDGRGAGRVAAALASS
ncbi:MAG: PseG/SpsG family protein, partial [Gemmatimonadota bacterium]